MAWLIENIVSVCVLIAVVLLIFLLVLYLVKSKKNASGCGGACTGCAMAGCCHRYSIQVSQETEKTDE